MAYLVIRKFYKDKRGRLCILIEGKLTDKNIWLNRKENRYSLCLEEHIIQVLPLLYGRTIAPYNEARATKKPMNFTKDFEQRKEFYIV